ncbi:hypothetical protein SBRY_110015 [Actinacidiphila bryophytorum]|uniref:Uncharacterized protein n=1 Tax=Actinacidiphila bryophytorum TaxID=1436133 RepID=A0A9W4GYB8_9ACTN|nr:hypothetical protein SBRY_110015 [Actinacidiphila bryophytorum]
MFRDVHRQLDELPDRGDGPGPARQRLGAGHPHRTQGPLRGRGPHRRGADPPLLRAGRRVRAAAGHRHPGRVRERHGPGHRHGRLHQHHPAPAGRRPGGRAGLRPDRHRRGLAPGAVPGQGRPERGARRHVLHGGRAPGRRHPGDPRRAVPRRAAERGRAHRPLALGQGVAGHLGRPRRLPVGAGRRAVARGPRLRALRPGLLPVRAVGDAGHRRGRRLHPRRRARLLQGRRPRGAARQPRRGRRRGEDRGRRRVDLDLRGTRGGVRVAGGGRREDPPQGDHPRRRHRDPLRGPARRPRHAGDALPDLVPQGPGPGEVLRADHRRPLLRRHFGPVHRPRLARGGLRRHHRAGRGRRPHPDRHPGAVHGTAGLRRGVGGPPGGARRCVRPARPRAQGLRVAAGVRGHGDQRGPRCGAGHLQARRLTGHFARLTGAAPGS